MPEDDVITSAADLDDEPAKEEEESKEDSNEEVAEDSTEEETGEDTAEEDSGGGTYSEEELQELLETGKRIKDYQAAHPGYDPIGIHRDYTQKTMELANLKKQQVQPSAPAAKEPEVDLSDVNAKDIEVVEKILRGKGYVHRSELEKIRTEDRRSNYEGVKKGQLKGFLDKHPEYQPSNDPTNTKWDALLNEFGLYKLPDDPSKIGALLERSHSSISGSSNSLDIKKASKILAQKKINKVGASTAGGKGGGAGKGKAQNKVSPELRDYLKGFSDEEKDEIFN